MSNDRKHTEKTSADSKAIGFDYQYYFFLWKLLSLKTGESVGYEVKDDVHTELANDHQILYQIKHTVKLNSSGSPKNLTTSDSDLWHTLSNWVQVITDANDGRENKGEQLKFLEKTSFVLASNKSSNSNNQVVNSIDLLQKGEKEIDEARTEFQTISDNTSDAELKKYIKTILNLEDDILKSFFLKLFFELDENDIIEKCKNALLSDKIEESKIDGLFAQLDSAIRENNFITIKNGMKVNVTFDDYYQKYRRYYTLARDSSLKIADFSDINMTPQELGEQIFIKQLIEIDECDESDLEDITELTIFKLKLRSNLKNWLHEGEITSEEVENFYNDCILKWKNNHKSAFRRAASDEELNQAALKTLDSTRAIGLSIAGQTLDTSMSNGSFYSLSDMPKIGWLKDWEKYKNED